MAKIVVTADCIRTAHKEGRSEFSVPPGALITPQARDDAKDLSIHLVFPTETGFSSGRNASGPSLSAAAAVPGAITLRAGQAFEEKRPAPPSGCTAGDIQSLCGAERRLGVTMIFLTEEDIRQRSVARGGELVLSPAERLTPSALTYIREQRIRIPAADDGQKTAPPPEMPAPDGGKQESRPDVARPGQGLTHLDAVTLVAKTHPRIKARGKLDNLMAEIVLAQTLFDPKDKLPAMLKECLADLKEWVFQTLAAEVSGSILSAQSMGGMNPDVLRAVSRNPRQYLGLDHLMPDAALGMNVALLNRLRTQVRETELAVAGAALCRDDIQESLNRLSGAVYVLMLLTRLAENGVALPKLG